MIARRRLNSGLLTLATVAAVLSCAAVSANASFTPAFDPTFGKGGVAIGASPGRDRYVQVSSIAPRPDGGWVAVGYRSGEDDFSGLERWFISVFRADGTPDTRFARRGQLLDSDPGKFARNGTGSRADAVAVQPDGKILVGGVVDVATRKDAAEYERESGGDVDCQCGASRGAFLIARYTTNGRLDRTFGKRGYHLIRGVTKSWTENGSLAQLKQIVAAPNGRIYVFGDSLYFSNGLTVNPKDRSRLLGFGLRRNGAAIKSFGTNGRLLASVGTAPNNFYLSRVALLASGEFALAGTSQRYTASDSVVSRMTTARVTSKGQLDRSFNGTGWRERSTGSTSRLVQSADVAADGSTTFILQRTSPDPTSSGDTVNSGVLLVGLKPDGELDQSFGGGLVDVTAASGGNQLTAGSVVRLADGSAAALSSVEAISPEVASLVPVSATGVVGTPFAVNPSGARLDFPATLAADGPRLVLGGSASVRGSQRAFFARLVSTSP